MSKSWLVRGAESADRARRRMQLLGVTPNGFPLWEPWEVEPVIGRYPDYQAIFPELARRTHPAVYSKAGRLGITRPRALPWSDNEILRLRKVYPKGTKEEILSAFPGRSYGAVARAANARGIYRARHPAKASGIHIVDQILDRAHRLNYSLIDLDAIGGRRGYFSRRRWRQKEVPAVHFRVAAALGGTVRAAFP